MYCVSIEVDSAFWTWIVRLYSVICAWSQWNVTCVGSKEIKCVWKSKSHDSSFSLNLTLDTCWTFTEHWTKDKWILLFYSVPGSLNSSLQELAVSLSTLYSLAGENLQHNAKLLDTGFQIPPHHHDFTFTSAFPLKIGLVHELNNDNYHPPWDNDVHTFANWGDPYKKYCWWHIIQFKESIYSFPQT